MRALAVIVLSPLFDDDLGLLECVEDVSVEVGEINRNHLVQSGGIIQRLPSLLLWSTSIAIKAKRFLSC